MIIPTLDFEQQLWDFGFTYVCGIDEVGRGSFAGPVVAGGVILPQNIDLPRGIRDSKLLTPKRREELDSQIKRCAIEWAVSESSVEVINKWGIGKATQIAFYNLVKSFKKDPSFILIDAFFIANIDKAKQKPIVNGDKLCMSIAAASIVAKVYRDGLMERLAEDYPEYGFAKNKGYGTLEHQEAIKKHGLSKVHRTSFKLTRFTL